MKLNYIKPTPLEALDEAILAGMIRTLPSKPGAVIERLPPEIREALTRLKSEQTKALRYPLP